MTAVKAPRSSWTGTLTVGMLTIPVKLYPIIEDRDVEFHRVHACADGRVGRSKQSWECTACGKEVAYSDLVKGHELPSKEMLPITDADLATLPKLPAKIVNVVSFVPADQIDPLTGNRGYRVATEPAGQKAYEVLRVALTRTGRVGMVRFTMRGKEHLAVLRAHATGLSLQTVAWPDEVRRPPIPTQRVSVSDPEVLMATGLIDALSRDFDPEDYQDDRRAAVLALIEAKASGTVVAATDAPVAAGGPVDVLVVLTASVEAARGKLVSA